MNLKNSLSVLGCNLSLIYKVLFFFFIMLLLAAAITVSIVNPVIKEVNHELSIQGIKISLETLLRSPIETVQGLWNTTISYFASNLGQLALRVFYVCLMAISMRLLTSIVLFPTNVMLFERMTAGNKVSMITSFISNFPKAIVYSLTSALIVGILDFSIMFFSVWIMIITYKGLKLISLFLALVIGLFLVSVRMTLTVNWLPVLISEERNVFRALTKGIVLSSHHFLSTLSVLFTINSVAVSVLLTLSLPTFGLVPVLAIPVWAILICILGLTSYFKARGKQYYTDNEGTVYTPPIQEEPLP